MPVTSEVLPYKRFVSAIMRWRYYRIFPIQKLARYMQNSKYLVKLHYILICPPRFWTSSGDGNSVYQGIQ